MTLRKCASSVGLQVHSDVENEFSPTRVTQGLTSNSRGTVGKFLQALSSNLQNKFFLLCPQLHNVVVKHKASVLVKWNKSK
jgi:hypothetical protein